MIPHTELHPGDLVGVNKDSYLVLDKLPPEYDNRVKAMEVCEKPIEDYSDIGGLDKQIQELIEAIVLPITHKERFEKIGIKPPKGTSLLVFVALSFCHRCFDARSSRHWQDSFG